MNHENLGRISGMCNEVKCGKNSQKVKKSCEKKS